MKRADELLADAQSQLDSGNLAAARTLTRKVEHLDATFDDVLAMNPEYMMALIERAERNSSTVPRH